MIGVVFFFNLWVVIKFMGFQAKGLGSNFVTVHTCLTRIKSFCYCKLFFFPSVKGDN